MTPRFTYLNYDVKQFPFEKLISFLFGIRELEDLHFLSEEEYKEQFQVGMDSSTVFHQRFYDKYRSGWPEMHNVYEDFIQKFIAPFYKEDFLFQAFPTFRVHLPNNIAVGAFHNDAAFGHPAGEVNYIIPLTKSNDTASVWVESEAGVEDFLPMDMKIGEVVRFNGNELTHGNKKNLTGHTRVSMDFRVLPISKYDEHNESESITRKTKFKEGEYYKKFIQSK